jgi:hypothetical protein
MTRNKTQSEKFKEAAKEAGADMSEAEFRRTVGKVAKAPKPAKSNSTGKSKQG